MALQRDAHAVPRLLDIIAIDALAARMRIAPLNFDAVIAHPSHAEAACPACVSRMHARTIRNGAT